ncbi:cilia- and flagella-associated protein 97 isoform X1 [Sebastes umbrosus]|uniref:cilia- and flagella-associated protein 97 isoform X1 n=1 Tax=Sebastes umbrosus TaxID=72105 RepID=UPI00189CF945|nr:cilia- and flagella-associated protein 97 isoform X1 [Sebastes umbrosus]
MFNPDELEGEVDHSFFDSDGSSREEGEKMEKGSKAEKENVAAHERLQTKQTENTKGGWSPRTDGTKKHLKPVDDNSSSRAEMEEKNCQSKEEEGRSRASSVSSVTSDKVINNSGDREEDSNLQSKRPNGRFMSFLDKVGEEYYKDVSSQSPNESEEEALPSKHTKGRNKQSPKKLVKCIRSPSPTSTESSVDADSESSFSSSNRRSSLDSPALPQPNKPSSSPGVSRTRAGSRDVPVGGTEESEDTVTDVSPLSSPDISPLQSLDLNHTEAEEGSLKGQQQQESVPSSGLSVLHQDSDQDVDECSFNSESQLGSKLVFCYPGGRNRKNYSFTNDEVRRIDHENQRLLRELSRHSPGTRPGSISRKKTPMASKTPHIRLTHSALNRQREQHRIERENLAFLKRLESVKPTSGLKRSEQLDDYHRQVGHVGAPSYPVSISTTTKRERSTSKTPSADPRPASSALHSSRAVSTNTDSSKTRVPRSKETAWC